MRACEYDRYGRADVIVLREVPMPTPAANQVRIRVRAAALNPKDSLTRAGKYRLLAGPRFPKRMGYDWAGEVDAVGARVRGIEVGAHVSTLTSAANLGFARELGADETLDYRSHDFTQAAARYDVIFDVWGNHTFKSARAALTSQGCYVSTVPKLQTIARQLRGFTTAQRARLVWVRSRRRDLEQLLSLVQSGALTPVIGQTFTLESIVDAHRALASNRTRGKIVIRVA